MGTVDIEMKETLEALRRKIHERGFTQLEVQQELGWGKGYISHLFRRKKELRFDQVFLILHAIGVEPREFFAELYGQTAIQTMPKEVDPLELMSYYDDDVLFENLLVTVRQLNSLVGKLVKVLVKNDVITHEELAAKLSPARPETIEIMLDDDSDENVIFD